MAEELLQRMEGYPNAGSAHRSDLVGLDRVSRQARLQLLQHRNGAETHAVVDGGATFLAPTHAHAQRRLARVKCLFSFRLDILLEMNDNICSTN